MYPVVFVATSNPGKLRDFAAAANILGIDARGIPDFDKFVEVKEDGNSFEANARLKAEGYSRQLPSQLIIADDSGLEVDALNGAPGIHSARYASSSNLDGQSIDAANNAKLLAELATRPSVARTARFVCVIAAARDGIILGTFRGEANGLIINSHRGDNGFGYDPLFYFPELDKTFAELGAEEKSKHSHRGAAFRKFLDWFRAQTDLVNNK